MGNSNRKIAVLVCNHFEESELTHVVKALQERKHQVDVISSRTKILEPMSGTEKGQEMTADFLLDDIDTDDYDALLLPGGVFNADLLRLNKKAQAWAEDFLDQGKLVAASGHAVLLLVSADLLEEKKVTGSPTIKDDICNAGGEWSNHTVAIEKNLITCRGGDDIDKLVDTVIDRFQQQ